MKGLRGVMALVLLGLGLFTASGCALAILFELQGFGGPRDEGPRALYISALSLGLLLSLLMPMVAWRWWARASPTFALVATALVSVLALLLFGLSWAG